MTDPKTGPLKGWALLRAAGICGMVAPFLSLIFIMAAISQAPWWSITDMSISRLAGARGDTPIWSASGAPAILLNIGLFITGALMTFFSYTLRSTGLFPRWSGSVGKFMFIASTKLLLLIGLIPLPLGIYHDIVSYSFFLTAAISMVLMGVSSHGIVKERTLGKVLIVLGVLMLAPFGLAWAFEGLAIPEILGLIPLVVFCQLIGYKLLKGHVD